MNNENIHILGNHDTNTIEQIKNCIKHEAVVGASLQADGHVGYSFPIGGVIAYDNHISPSGVGFDIGCGNLALRTDMSGKDLRDNIKPIMDDIARTIEFGIGKGDGRWRDDAMFSCRTIWDDLPHIGAMKDMARNQLGTVGSGNHYVDVFTDEEDLVWIGVHFGSRGLGHKIATYYLKAGGAKDGMMVDPLVLDVNSDLGKEYLLAMELAGHYAHKGRIYVSYVVLKLLERYNSYPFKDISVTEEIHNHHNYAWSEQHNGKSVYVVRKGATPAFPGQKGFVGGSMGDISVILEGIESPKSKESLYSTVHGAGRILSRTQAAGKINRKTGERITEGQISEQMMKDWVTKAKVELRGAGTDESPHCYKRLPEVLSYHQDTIRILHTLTPVGVAMAGADVKDLPDD